MKLINESFINDKKIISDLNSTMAEAYLKLKKTDSAKIYFKKAIENNIKGKKSIDINLFLLSFMKKKMQLIQLKNILGLY